MHTEKKTRLYAGIFLTRATATTPSAKSGTPVPPVPALPSTPLLPRGPPKKAPPPTAGDPAAAVRTPAKGRRGRCQTLDRCSTSGGVRAEGRPSDRPEIMESRTDAAIRMYVRCS